jgi:hypothetical protein
MMRRLVVAMAFFVVAAQGARAEAQRALFTHENKFPEVGKGEVGSFFEYREFDAADITSIRPYGRYTVIQNLTVYGDIPYHWLTPQDGDDQTGLGDMNIGLELLAYQDIFEYPWVIPHVNMSFPTGDEDDGLSTGDEVTTFGISIGTTVFDQLHYVADISYAVNGGNEQPDADNVFIFSGSLIWDVTQQFAVLAEIQGTDEDNPEDDVPYTALGGMVYGFTDAFEMGFYFGGSATGGGSAEEDLITAVKASYAF